MADTDWYDKKIKAEKTPPENYTEDEKRIWMYGYIHGRTTIGLENLKAGAERINAILDEPQKSIEYVPIHIGVGRIIYQGVGAIFSIFKRPNNDNITQK